MVMENHFKIYYLEDKEITKYPEKSSNIHEIAPYQSKCKDWDWRMSLKVNDELDASDTTNVWYNATVLEERKLPIEEDRYYREVKIGTQIQLISPPRLPCIRR